MIHRCRPILFHISHIGSNQICVDGAYLHSVLHKNLSRLLRGESVNVFACHHVCMSGHAGFTELGMMHHVWMFIFIAVCLCCYISSYARSSLHGRWVTAFCARQHWGQASCLFSSRSVACSLIACCPCRLVLCCLLNLTYCLQDAFGNLSVYKKDLICKMLTPACTQGEHRKI